MKDIGRTNEGAHLVEMSDEEHATFIALQLASAGRDFMATFYAREGLQSREMASVFKAIQAWVLVKDKGNMLRQLASQLDEVIKLVDDAPST